MGLIFPSVGSTILRMYETDAAPAVSYLSYGVSIREAQPIFCQATKTFWICTDASDQESLVWVQLATV